jgi:DMSO/TMAO reductase YedYZ heme-binding membrane subunit
MTIWAIDRASGIAALVLASLSIVAGLLQGSDVKFLRRADRFPIHEALGLSVIVAIAVHGASYAFDGYFSAGVSGTLVPFASPYRPLAVAVGQIAAHGLVGLSVTFYVRKRIGTPRWRSAHRWISLFWLLSVVHAAAAGTDAMQPWFLLSVIGPVAAALYGLGPRVFGPPASS